MRAVFPVLFIALGCTDAVLDEPFEIDDPTIYTCKNMNCQNSPEVLRNGVYHASIYGQPDDNGYYLEAKGGRAQIFTPSGSWDLNVVNGRLFGTSRTRRDQLEHDELVGSELHLMLEGKRVYAIRIAKVTELVMPFGTLAKQEVYEMLWAPAGEEFPSQGICNPSVWPIDKDQTMGMGPNDVILHEGDDYDVKLKTVKQAWNADWFNFGCAGRTLAKLRLLGYTRDNQPTSNLPWGGGREERQAAFKMMTGDYCGTGEEYTETGIKVMWSNGDHIPYPSSTPPAVDDLEALWTERGASCVDHARLQEAIGVDVWARMQADGCYLSTCYSISPPPSAPVGPFSFGVNAKLITAHW